MLTVPEAARRTGRNPETIRRWIRSGKLRARKVGTQHVIEEADLDQVVSYPGTLPLPPEWRTTSTGEPQPDWVRIIREGREGFSSFLELVEHRRDEFIIKRHGKEVARIVAAGPRRITWGQLYELITDWPKPDGDFAEDLRRIRAEQPMLNDEDAWERYSTHRS